MNKKIAFVVVVLVVLVATFCVSFAGMPVNKIGTVDVTLPLSNIIVPSSWEGKLLVDLNLAQDYGQVLYEVDIAIGFRSPSNGISAFEYNGSDFVDSGLSVSSFTIESSEIGYEAYQVSSLVVSNMIDGGYVRLFAGSFVFVLPSDTEFIVFLDGVQLDNSQIEQYLPILPSELYGFMEFVPFVAPLLGETVINNIIDTLWGTVVSVGDSFGEGMNQMVGDLFFDLETGDLSAFSIVIICFFALCLLVTIVNWLFFRLTNIKKF